MGKTSSLPALAGIAAVATAMLGHELLGASRGAATVAPVAAAQSSGEPAAAPTTAAVGMQPPGSAHASMREWRRFCGSADRTAAAELRSAALTDADPLIAGNALRALGRLQLVACDPELRALLSDPRPRVRQEAVIAMGGCGDPTAVAAIAPLLQESTLRSLAIQALGRLGGSQARALLDQVMGDPRSTPTDCAFARSALAQLEAASARGGRR